MREFLKTNQKLLICAAAGLVAGLLLGLAIPAGRAAGNGAEELSEVGRIGIVNIVPETKLHFTYQFSGCTHRVEREPDALPYVGQTQEEFQKEFPDAMIDSFSAADVQLSWVRVGACPEHVMLKADDLGQLHIYQANRETLEIESIQTLSLYAASFDAETAEELYEGIVFDTADQVNGYLESAES